MWTLFIQSLRAGGKQWKVISFVYLFQLLLTATLALQVKNIIQEHLGTSLSAQTLLNGYHHATWSDFMHFYGDMFAPVMGQMQVLLLLYLVMAIFLQGGQLVVAHSAENASIQHFVNAGIMHFVPFLKILLLFVILLLIWTALIFVPIAPFFTKMLTQNINEKQVIAGGIFALAVYVLGVSVLFVVAIFSRLIFITQKTSIFISVKKGFQAVFAHRKKVVGTSSLFVFLQIMLTGLYLLFSQNWNTHTTLALIVLILIQQLAIWLRIYARQSIYHAFAAMIFSSKSEESRLK